MTVVDTGGIIDYLLGWDAADDVERLLDEERELHAPDVLVFEVLSALRRQVQRGLLAGDRATGAVRDLDDLPLLLHASAGLRMRAWALRDSFTIGDGLFIALAESLGEPLATTDGPMVGAASSLPDLGTEVVPLGNFDR